jgi:AmmeMemoRadiSam system protein B
MIKKLLFLNLLLFGLNFIIHVQFLPAKGQIAGISTQTSQIHGLILPHHDLARELIITAATEVKSQASPETIVVLSPNHFVPEGPSALTATSLLDFPLDESVIENLLKSGSLVPDESALSLEHGLLIPISYLSQAFPQARFVPVMISPLNYSPPKIHSLATALAQTSPPNTLFVLSTDFSHDTQLQVALTNNQTTIHLLETFNVPTLLTLSDSHLDAPVAAAIFLKIMQYKNATHWQTYASTHGALLTGDPLLQGTSYVTGTFSTPSN